MERVLVQKRAYGGLSEDEKDGEEHAFFFGRSLDFRTKPSVVRILPKTAKESGTTVTDLLKWFEPIGTDMYSLGDTGKLYKRTNAAVWSNPTTLTTCTGNGLAYFPIDDYLYIPKDKVIARYGPITPGSPAVTQDYFTDGTVDLDQFLDTSGSTYAIPTAISETAANRQTFTPSRDPQRRLQINVSAVGTSADWTVTVHDKSNNVIATKTNLFAVMATGDINFDFATPWRPVLGGEYHFHVTVTNTTGTPALVSGSGSDLEAADFHTYYQILVTDTAFHPAVEFLGNLCIGNERYVATYNGIDKAAGTSVYNPHRLTLPPGWKVRDEEKVGEYLAVVAVKSNTITQFDEGFIGFWDGASSAFTFIHYVQDGAITAARVDGSTLYYITTAGQIYAWFNGQVVKLKTLPKMTQQTYVEVFPGAFESWKGLQIIGIAGNSDSTVLEKGAYSYGRLNDKYPRALNYDYPISTGTRTGTGLAIGAIGKIGDTLFIGWKDGATYGCDVVTSTAQPFTSALFESLISDGMRPEKKKKARGIKVTHSALISGQSVQIGQKVDRTTSYTDDTANSVVGTTETLYLLGESEHKEIQMRYQLVTSGANNLEITSLALLYDDLSEEELF